MGPSGRRFDPCHSDQKSRFWPQVEAARETLRLCILFDEVIAIIVKNVIATVAGLIGTATAIYLLKSNSTKITNISPKSPVEPEKLFAGIPLSKLSELAKQIYHGLYCTIDQWGFLVFHSKSNRGHQTFHTQMTLDDAGKLINLGGHYPGQWWSSADEFAKKANEIFEFKK